jgi:hypothetical protein
MQQLAILPSLMQLYPSVVKTPGRIWSYRGIRSVHQQSSMQWLSESKTDEKLLQIQQSDGNAATSNQPFAYAASTQVWLRHKVETDRIEWLRVSVNNKPCDDWVGEKRMINYFGYK